MKGIALLLGVLLLTAAGGQAGDTEAARNVADSEWYFPEWLARGQDQMKRIESGAVTPAEIDRFQELQWAYARRLITRPLAEAFLVKDLTGFAWPDPVCGELGCRKDNDYKHVPSR
jgi:hypothetical protein